MNRKLALYAAAGVAALAAWWYWRRPALSGQAAPSTDPNDPAWLARVSTGKRLLAK